MDKKIVMYGAQWCSDCRRSKNLLDELAVDWDYIDLIANPSEVETAKRISGTMNIPVITFTDGTHLVEPSDAELRAKVESLA